jgi:transposase
MSKKLQRRTPEFKIQVTLETLKGELSVAQIACKYGIHPKQVTDWRDELISEGKSVFIPKTSLRRTKTDLEKDELLMRIGQLSLEVEFLKKKQGNK